MRSLFSESDASEHPRPAIYAQGKLRWPKQTLKERQWIADVLKQ